MDSLAVNRSNRGFGVFSAWVLSGALFATQVFAQAPADVKACEEKKGDEAIAACTRAIEAGPKSKNISMVYFNRAAEWKAAKDYDRAIADYSEAIKRNPQYREAFNNRGNAYRSKRDLDLAIADYDSAIKINPQRARIFAGAERTLAWKRGAMNNVGLASDMTYSRHYPLMETVYQTLGGDLAKTVAFFKQVDKQKPARAAALKRLRIGDEKSAQFVRAYEAVVVDTITSVLRARVGAVAPGQLK